MLFFVYFMAKHPMDSAYISKKANIYVGKIYNIEISKDSIFQVLSPCHGYSASIDNAKDSLFIIYFNQTTDLKLNALVRIKQNEENKTILILDSIIGYEYPGNIDTITIQRIINSLDKTNLINQFDVKVIQQFKYDYNLIKPIYYDNKKIIDSFIKNKIIKL